MPVTSVRDGVSEMLSYALITPARNEAENLARLAPCLIGQTQLPVRWLIVDNGSTDETAAIALSRAQAHDWITVLATPGEDRPTRGAPVVRAFHAGLAALGDDADVIVKLDADVSFDADYFARQLDAFARDPRLGISSGVCLEPNAAGGWSAARVTRDHVRGAIRAYRQECLDQVLPLEERMGWDGIDELKAQVRGWRTTTLQDLSFHHHRSLAERESRWQKWSRQGGMAHFMGYRFSYLLARTAYHVVREPSAAAMPVSYAAAAIRGTPRCSAGDAIAHLRAQQSVHSLPARIREKLGQPA